MKGMKWVAGLVVLFLCGCATTPYSLPLSQKAKTQTPGEGIPYYLPHPYLVVTKNLTYVTAEKAESTEKKSGQETAAAAVGSGKSDAVGGADIYSMHVIYLPDADQKYALYFKRGTGTYDSAIVLADGWKLTGLNMKGDAKTSETIQALGSIIKDNISTIATSGGKVAALQEAVPGVTAPRKKVAPAVGIWIYDLMGGTPYPCVFTWTSEENKK